VESAGSAADVQPLQEPKEIRVKRRTATLSGGRLVALLKSLDQKHLTQLVKVKLTPDP